MMIVWRKYLVCLLAALLCGCAANYKPSSRPAGPVSIEVPGSQLEVFRKTLLALVAEGYSPAMSDEATGIITTQRRQMQLSAADVDAGSTWGINYMKDRRTITFVTLVAQAQPGKVVIRSDIDAEYLPSDPVYGKRMKGVSLGTVEGQIAHRLLNP